MNNLLTTLDLYAHSSQHRAHENVGWVCPCDGCNNGEPFIPESNFLAHRTQLYFGGPGSGCNPEAGKCGRPPGPGHPDDHSATGPHATVAKKFERYDKMVKAVDSKKINGLAVFGAPGIGKSKTVIDALENSKNNVIKIRGQITPKELFNTLSANRGPDDIVWFDDADSAFKDNTSRNILKAVLDSDEPREVSWLSSKKEEGEEQTFRFQGRIIVTTNIDLDSNNDVKAVLDRVHWVNLDLSPAEKMARIRQIAPKLMTTVDKATQNKIIDWMDKHRDDLGEGLSLRTAKKIAEVASFDDDWEGTAQSYADAGRKAAKEKGSASTPASVRDNPAEGSPTKSTTPKVGKLNKYGRAASDKGFTQVSKDTFKHPKGTLTYDGKRDWSFKPTSGKATSGKGFNNFTKFIATLK